MLVGPLLFELRTGFRRLFRRMRRGPPGRQHPVEQPLHPATSVVGKMIACLIPVRVGSRTLTGLVRPGHLPAWLGTGLLIRDWRSIVGRLDGLVSRLIMVRRHCVVRTVPLRRVVHSVSWPDVDT